MMLELNITSVEQKTFQFRYKTIQKSTFMKIFTLHCYTLYLDQYDLTVSKRGCYKFITYVFIFDLFLFSSQC